MHHIIMFFNENIGIIVDPAIHLA